MPKTICLDLDDTLIQTQENYEKVNNKLIVLLQQERFIPNKEIMNKQSEIDISLIKTQGFSTNRFPTSWVQTFAHFLGNDFNFQDIVYTEAGKIFSNKIDLHEDAKRFLKTVKEMDQEVWIVTHGDYDIQNKRIEDTELQWVDKIIISEHKNLALYQNLRAQSSSKLIMIGNSVRHDILPAIEAGLIGIHIQRQYVWKYDVVEPDNTFLSYKSLDNILNYIKEEI